MAWDDVSGYLQEDDTFTELVDQNGRWLQQYLNRESEEGRTFRVFAQEIDTAGEYPAAEIRVFDLDSSWCHPDDDPAIRIEAELQYDRSIDRRVEDVNEDDAHGLLFPLDYFLNEEWRSGGEELKTGYRLGAPEPSHGRRVR